MMTKFASIVAALCLLLLGSKACADDKPGAGVPQDEQVMRIYRSIWIDTLTESGAKIAESYSSAGIDLDADWGKEMTLGDFLSTIEARAKAKDKFTIRLDTTGLGRDAQRISSTKVKISSLPGATVLAYVQDAYGQVSKKIGSELDYRIRPDGVVITWARLAAYRAEYDLRKVFRPIELPAQVLKDFLENLGETDISDDRETLLAQALTTTVPMRPWESVELINGSKLVANCSIQRQEQIVDMLVQLRALADIYVVMNARLIKVEKAFFDKHVAGLFEKTAQGVDPSPVVMINESLFKLLAAQEKLIASDDVKIQQYRDTVFLSRHSPFQFSPVSQSPEGTGTTMGVEGLAFVVHPRISSDRRYIRLQITQRAEQLRGKQKTVHRRLLWTTG